MSGATGTSTDWLTVIGRGSPSDERRLMAGSLSATLSGLDLLDVRVDGIEVMRRLCVRVRDTNWGTIAPATSDVAVEETGAGFAVTFNAHHVSKEIDFAWSGRVSGDARGSLEFAMEGEARAKCTFFRIGLIVLHPTNLAVASSIVAARDGDRRSLTAPRLVAPVEIVDGLETPLIAAFNQLSLRWSDGLATTFAFTGDLFEMEDQRNWGDGSFKTFSTPLSVPLPLRLQRGDRLRQALSFGWTAPRSATAAAAATAVIVVTVGEPLGQRLPSTGLSIDADRHMPTADEAALLRSIRPAHLRGEIDLSDKREAISDIRRCKQIADSINAPLELACIVPAPLADLTGMLRAIEAELAISATRVALLPANGSVTPLEWLNQLPAVFGSSPDATVGTCSDFVELNR
ncbi:MAG TPA: hypothetical protein VG894_07415, partial [Bauldia sp.]|nr:hypothetical protein [Bauldia sp.]